MKHFMVAAVAILVGASFMDAGPLGIFGGNRGGGTCANGSCSVATSSVTRTVSIQPPTAPAVVIQRVPVPRTGVVAIAPAASVEALPMPIKNAVSANATYSRTAVAAKQGFFSRREHRLFGREFRLMGRGQGFRIFRR